MADRVGTQIGNYRLVRFLGRGGISDVYLAEHLMLGSTAAVKVLNITLPEDGFRAFNSEARTIARVAHPHIIRILDFGILEDKISYGRSIPYLVMDYAPNGSLRSLHPRGTTLPLETVIGYVTQIASALQYMHEQKLLHLDVKPENMLLGRNNEILLSESDIAFTSLSIRTQTLTQETTGTAAYMAPEQMSAKPVPASDQYALSIAVYEWLSGSLPFTGSTMEIFIQHISTKPPSLREKVPVISSAVEDAVMKALAKKPEDRFPSVIDFAQALERAAKPTPFLQTPVVPAPQQSAYPSTAYGQYQPANPYTPPPYQATTPVYSSYPSTPPRTIGVYPQSIPSPAVSPKASPTGLSRRTIVLGGVIGLIGLAGAEMLASGKLPLSRLFTKMLIPTSIVRPTPSSSVSGVGIGTRVSTYTGHIDVVTAVAWSPNGTLIASSSLDGTVQIWKPLTATPFSVLRQFNGSSVGAIAVIWSPHGNEVASGSQDKVVSIWDINSQQTIEAKSIANLGVPNALSWSPNDKLIAVAYQYGQILLFSPPPASRQPKDVLLMSIQQGNATVVRWSPDGRRLASAYDDGSIALWNTPLSTTSKAITTYANSTIRVEALDWSPTNKYIASASDDHTVHINDASNGNMLFTYTKHTDAVFTVAWSPDGKRIASGGKDHTVQIWSANGTGSPFTYTGHTDGVTSVAWSPDGKYIASSSQDKTVQVWRAS